MPATLSPKGPWTCPVPLLHPGHPPGTHANQTLSLGTWSTKSQPPHLRAKSCPRATRLPAHPVAAPHTAAPLLRATRSTQHCGRVTVHLGLGMETLSVKGRAVTRLCSSWSSLLRIFLYVISQIFKMAKPLSSWAVQNQALGQMGPGPGLLTLLQMGTPGPGPQTGVAASPGGSSEPTGTGDLPSSQTICTKWRMLPSWSRPLGRPGARTPWRQALALLALQVGGWESRCLHTGKRRAGLSPPVAG